MTGTTEWPGGGPEERMRTDRGRALGADGGNAEVDGWGRLEGKRMKTPTNLESVTN
jgi:hypothetical protein